jgi:L-ascorbate metabolism protein UlaG (beta-lactamase superfamily)
MTTWMQTRCWSVRNFMDRNENLWGGWVVKAPAHRFYYAGDTGYSADFKAIGERFGGFDLAAIPVGAHSPRWFMQDQHIDPAMAGASGIPLSRGASVSSSLAQ